MLIGNNLEYDLSRDFYEQDEAVLEYLNVVMVQPPYSQQVETVDANNSRVTEQIFDLGTAWLKITFIYNSPANSREWAGLNNQKFEVYGK